MSNDYSLISAALKRLRGPASQAETARLCGISQQSYNRYEAGAVMPKHDALRKIALHYGLTVDQLLAGGDGPRELTLASLPPDSAADPAVARRLAAPANTLTHRERMAQLAVAGYDAAHARGKSGQYAVLMEHIVGVVDGQGDCAWHRDQLRDMIDEHFSPQPGKPAGEKP